MKLFKTWGDINHRDCNNNTFLNHIKTRRKQYCVRLKNKYSILKNMKTQLYYKRKSQKETNTIQIIQKIKCNINTQHAQLRIKFECVETLMIRWEIDFPPFRRFLRYRLGAFCIPIRSLLRLLLLKVGILRRGEIPPIARISRLRRRITARRQLRYGIPTRNRGLRCYRRRFFCAQRRRPCVILCFRGF